MDVALCEGWIVADDVTEPFLQLGMPAAAVAYNNNDNYMIMMIMPIITCRSSACGGGREE